MRFQYHRPESLKKAVRLLGEYGPDAAVLAGGTALLVDIRNGESRPDHLISLWDIPGLDAIRVNGDLMIGALTTVTELAQALVEQQPLMALREAALLLGGRQIQNMATVAGNICKASPGADMIPPLLCLDAKLGLFGPDGQRVVPLDGFITGPDQTAIRTSEIVREIKAPAIPPRTGTAFLKIMRRQAIDCSIVAAAARVTLAEDGKTCQEARIAVGAAAPIPFRAKEAESHLSGREMSLELAQQAAQLAREASVPISDVRASADYRRLLVETLVERALVKATERATAEGVI
jgi:carbon-monoxide dehydrogenase medium subunit